MTYRSRYLNQLQVSPLLDLLLTDETNPRSVLFQVSAIVDHVANLPRKGNSARRNMEERVALALQHYLQMADVYQLAKIDDSGEVKERSNSFICWPNSAPSYRVWPMSSLTNISCIRRFPNSSSTLAGRDRSETLPSYAYHDLRVRGRSTRLPKPDAPLAPRNHIAGLSLASAAHSPPARIAADRGWTTSATRRNTFPSRRPHKELKVTAISESRGPRKGLADVDHARVGNDS